MKSLKRATAIETLLHSDEEMEDMILDEIDQRLADLEDIDVDAKILVRHMAPVTLAVLHRCRWNSRASSTNAVAGCLLSLLVAPCLSLSLRFLLLGQVSSSQAVGSDLTQETFSVQKLYLVDTLLKVWLPAKVSSQCIEFLPESSKNAMVGSSYPGPSRSRSTSY